MKANDAEIDRIPPFHARILGIWVIGAAAACMVCLVGGCNLCRAKPAGAGAPIVDDTVMTRTELYFGLSKHDGGEISPQEFDAFVAEVVTPRFPEGLTIVDAIGQWRNSNGNIVHEKSKLLIVLHESGAPGVRAIEEIRDQHKSRFGQESVMRVTSSAGVAF